MYKVVAVAFDADCAHVNANVPAVAPTRKVPDTSTVNGVPTPKPPYVRVEPIAVGSWRTL